ncbi:hypothetical protein [Paraburkholderia phenoliruptrix]|uniref:hypothetical protein n=1 Tax=Paraburkholderia phenoliruptrix TaxID=252970 RepID=UPI001C6E51D1|nr:hypothetical protein [Paraburkholderia phenoliruptrix]MBW9102965.1 hypothetical protein [Paraburkholderia phenoliruptrix]MBW9132939.1 hypothetical protein [Paraburkholderia ginsengiterrae]
MSDFWNEGVKSIVTALGGMGTFWVGGRMWRQIDRRRQAESEGGAEIVKADAAGQVESIARFERLATLAEERAARAETRELLAVQRADRAEELMRNAERRAEESERRARHAEAEVQELKRRIENLELALGNRRAADGADS